MYYISLSSHSLLVQNSDIAANTETNSNTKITNLSMPLDSDYVLKEPVVDGAQIVVCRPYLVELRIWQIVCSVHHVIKECPQPIELLLRLHHNVFLSWCHDCNVLVSEYSVASRNNPKLLVCERRTCHLCESL